jgi:protein phosphatase
MSESEIQIEVFGKTDVGLIREHNEDNLLIADLGGTFRESSLDQPAKLTLSARGALFLVCDGMGGAAAGEVASQMAVDAVFDSMRAADPQAHEPFARSLRHAVEVANDRIFQQSRDNQSERGMGTTCTAAALIDETLMVAQIGDSRCYVFRNGKLGQVTKDQSLAWQLIEAGAMTAEDAKAFEHANIILQALGVQDRVDVVMSQIALRKGDVVLLCSDGLHGPVTDQEIRDILAAEPDLKRAGEGLLQKALERDGPDNITVILARFDGGGLKDPSPDDTVGFVGYDVGRDGSSGGSDAAARPTMTGLAAVTDAASPRQSGDGGSGGTRARRKSRGVPAGARPGARRAADSSARDGRSVIALFFLVLIAVAVGSVSVLKCERDAAPRSEGAARTP